MACIFLSSLTIPNVRQCCLKIESEQDWSIDSGWEKQREVCYFDSDTKTKAWLDGLVFTPHVHQWALGTDPDAGSLVVFPCISLDSY